MANYTADVIAAAVADVRKNTGEEITYRSGQWYIGSWVQISGGIQIKRTVPANTAQQANWNNVLETYRLQKVGTKPWPVRASGAVGSVVSNLQSNIGTISTNLKNDFGGTVRGAIGGAARNLVNGARGDIRGTITGFNTIRQSPLVQVAGSVLGGVGGIVANVAQGALHLLMTGLQGVVGLLTSTLHHLVDAFHSVIDSAFTWSRSLALIHANTGYSFTQSFGIASRNSLFGISPQSTAQMLAQSDSNPLLARVRGGMWGLPTQDDPNYLIALNARYQSMANGGPFGRMMANNFLNQQYGGQAPDDVRLLVNQNPENIRSQLAWGQNFQAKMGIDPEMLRRYAEEVPNAMNRIGFALEQAKVALAVKLTPLIEKAVTAFATFIGNNADKIANVVQTIGSWLVEKLPVYVLNGAAGLAHGAAALLRVIGGFAGGIADNAAGILQGVDIFLNTLRNFAGNLAGLVAGIVQVVANFLSAIQSSGILSAAQNISQRVGSAVTGQDNDTPENQISNTVTGATTLATGYYILRGGQRIWVRRAAGRAASRAAAASAEATTAEATGAEAAEAGLGARLLPFFGRVGAGAWRIAVGGAEAASGTAAGAAGLVLTIGSVVGGGLYNVTRAKDMPSAQQIASYYWNSTVRGYNDLDAARFAQGATNTLQEQRDANATKQQQDAQKTALPASGQPVSGQPASGPASAGLTVQNATDFMGALAPQSGRSFGDAFTQGRDSFFNLIPQSHLADNQDAIDTLKRLGNGTRDATNDGAKGLDDFGDTVAGYATNWPQMLTDYMKDISNSSKQTADNTGKTAEANQKLPNMMQDFMRNALARTSALIAEDETMNLLRI